MEKIGFVIGRLFVLLWPLITLLIFDCLVRHISGWWIGIAVIIQLLVFFCVFHGGVKVIGKNDPTRLSEEDEFSNKSLEKEGE
jgi:uncharacterized protein (DUF58 family)